MIQEVDEKQYGETPQECFDEGLPDKDGNFYFEALITNSIYCSPDKYRAHTFFNICEFETENPIPNLNYNKRFAKSYGKLLGNTIELIPMTRYKFKAKPEYNSNYNEWQYKILNVWESESRDSDALNSYLRFLATSNSYNIIMKNDPDFVRKILEDDSFVGERFKGMQQKTYDKLIKELREYRDYIPIIAEFSQFPEITMNTIISMNDIASNPQQAFKIIKGNPYILTSLPRFWMEKSR